MKTDSELEAALRRYRPAGPPPELRGRVLDGAVSRPRTWPWALAAAALLAITVASHSAAAHLRASDPASVPTESSWTEGEAGAALREAYGEQLPAVVAYVAAVAATEHPEPQPPEADPWR